jgi:tRNA(His) guanylyltransferase
VREDEFGDRMKGYEGLTNVQLLPGVPVCARLDGRGFHSFTKHAKRPFSEIFHSMMVAVTRHLVVESCATVGYTQSDEISLAWLDVPFFDGNPQKMCSTLAAMASVRLNLQAFVTTSSDGTMGTCATHREVKSGLRWSSEPTFDCRVWVVPSRVEAANVFLWRQQDASRNSVQMAARHHFSHKACDNLNGKQLQEKLHTEAGINWNNYPTQFKRGTFVKHAKTQRAFTPEELTDLPPLHDARKDPSLVVERRVLVECDLDLRSIGDRVGALFTDAAM